MHEVAVGPVHAGVIEPGHFRFQCHGEDVFHLEISLGYQHRGVERALVGGPDKRTHPRRWRRSRATPRSATPTAYCQALEALAGRARRRARPGASAAIALELERLANHTGDLGALANDVGFLPTASYCGRLRGDFLNMTAPALRQPLRPRPGPAGRRRVRRRRRRDRARCARAARRRRARRRGRASSSSGTAASVQARFEETGAGLRRGRRGARPGRASPPAPAASSATCGTIIPSGIFRFAHIPVSAWHDRRRLRPGLRALARRSSARSRSSREQLRRAARRGRSRVECGAARAGPAGRLAGRGLARRDLPRGHHRRATAGFAAYKVVDPSFHNWIGLAMALRDQQISDFPLCNKSFNLSTAGTISERAACRCSRSSSRASSQGHRTIAYPAAEPDAARPLPRPAGARRERSAPTAAGRASRPARPTRSRADGSQGSRLDLGRCLFCTDCVAGLPRGRDRATPGTTAWPRARARTCRATARRAARAPAARREDAPALRPLAQARVRSAPAAATAARPT